MTGDPVGLGTGFRHPQAPVTLDTPPVIRLSQRRSFFIWPEIPHIVFKMSLEPPTYLGSLQNNIRARPIPWEGAVRAGNITDDHLKKIKAVDKVRKDQRRQTIEGDLAGYTDLLAGGTQGKSVLDLASRRTDIVQYILVLAADLIQGAFY